MSLVGCFISKSGVWAAPHGAGVTLLPGSGMGQGGLCPPLRCLGMARTPGPFLLPGAFPRNPSCATTSGSPHSTRLPHLPVPSSPGLCAEWRRVLCVAPAPLVEEPWVFLL